MRRMVVIEALVILPVETPRGISGLPDRGMNGRENERGIFSPGILDQPHNTGIGRSAGPCRRIAASQTLTGAQRCAATL
jgi:hypothetical protein